MVDLLNKKRESRLTIVLHLLVWSIMLLLPFLTAKDSPRQLNDYFRMWLPPVASAVIFYGNYLYFIPNLFFNKRTSLFLAGNLVLYVAVIFIMESIRVSAFPASPDGRGPNTIEMITRIAITFVMTTGVAVAIRITGAWFKSETQRKELERERVQTELANLKNQLNPHFFFNTLNTIYGLIPQQPDSAQQAVHRLSKLMRYHLYESNEQFVPLEQEIKFIHNYIDLMQFRLTPAVSVTCKFPEHTNGIQVAPLLFITLIENSFKHGINLHKPSSIDMVMDITNNKTIVFQIRNTSFPSKESAEPASGIGIENLKKKVVAFVSG
ncbi:MAG: signal transduction histidine kinase LytS [Bacteroidetes bacterium OLB12]|nr:MAG: signal transduction histidine kinase LytS [Bacteroidetes bacterium OLB12]